MRSLRRTLAVRFAATMAAGLILATGAFYWSASRALQESVPAAALRFDLLLVLIAIVVTGTAATLMGAWHFTSSAVRPVDEITAQATRIEAGTLDQRILAHADTEEYEGLVAVLNRMLERLERGFAAQRRLTANVSHELRTPLTAMRGSIEVALRAPRSQREYEQVLRGELEAIAARQAARTIDSATLARMRGLLDQMRASAARGDAHAQALQNSEFHNCVIVASGNRTLQRLWAMLEPFARTYLTATVPGADLHWLAERHVTILDALEAAGQLRGPATKRTYARQLVDLATGALVRAGHDFPISGLRAELRANVDLFFDGAVQDAP